MTLPTNSADSAPRNAPAPASALAVGVAHGQLSAIAARPFQAGEVIVRLTGRTVAEPTRFSVQVDENIHIDPPEAADLSELIGDHAWRYMNHSCEPNSAFEGRILRALRPIAVGEHVTFHYAATEYVMADPFVCGCGSAACLGQVSGYRDLGADARRRLAAYAQPHVLAMARREARERSPDCEDAAS